LSESVVDDWLCAAAAKVAKGPTGLDGTVPGPCTMHALLACSAIQLLLSGQQCGLQCSRRRKNHSAVSAAQALSPS
jgi:hypothetical protein